MTRLYGRPLDENGGIEFSHPIFDPLDAQDLVARMPWLTRLLLWVWARRLNHDVFAPVLNRAYERRVITSRQLHELHHHFDPTQHTGTVGRIARRS